MVGSAVSG